MVSKELSNDINPILYKPSKTIHSISLPFTFINSAIAPKIFSQTFSLIICKLAFISIAIFPSVDSLTMFLTLYKLSLIFFSVLKIKFTKAIFYIIFPCTLINITIPITIFSLVAFVVFKIAIKYIAIEECQFTLDFLVLLPTTTKYSSFAEKVVAFSVFFALEKLSDIFVLIGILEISNTMRQMILILSSIHTSI